MLDRALGAQAIRHTLTRDLTIDLGICFAVDKLDADV
jgi:hypothetical protein